METTSTSPPSSPTTMLPTTQNNLNDLDNNEHTENLENQHLQNATLATEMSTAELLEALSQARTATQQAVERADHDAQERMDLHLRLEASEDRNTLTENDLQATREHTAQIEKTHAQTVQNALEENDRLHDLVQEAEEQAHQLSSELITQTEKLTGAAAETATNGTNHAEPRPQTGSTLMNALAAKGILTSISDFKYQAASVIASHPEFRQTDEFLAIDNNVSSAVAYIQKMTGSYGSKTIKLLCEKFENVVVSSSTSIETLHTTVVRFMYQISQTLSPSSTGRTLVHLTTRKFIAGDTCEISRQICSILHAYSVTTDQQVPEFIAGCKLKRICTTATATAFPEDETQAPGIRRLNSSDPDKQTKAWTEVMEAIFAFLFTGRVLRTRQTEAALHNLETNPSIAMGIDKQGEVENAALWLSRYQAMRQRLIESSQRLDCPKLRPDDFDSIELAIMTSPTELRTKVYDVLRLTVPTVEYHEQEKNDKTFPIPKITFRQFENHLLTAYKQFQCFPDMGLTKEVARRTPEEIAQQNTTAPVTQPPSNTTATRAKNDKTNKAKKLRKCAICKSDSHQAQACNQMTPDVQQCNYWSTHGRCRWGTNCKNRHTAQDSPPAQGTALATTTTVTSEAAPKWVECTCKDCAGKHFENEVYWMNKFGSDGKAYGMPPRCKACRDANRAKRSNYQPQPTSLPVGTSPPPATPIIHQAQSVVVQTPATPTAEPMMPEVPQPATVTQLMAVETGSQYACLQEQLRDEDESETEVESSMMVTSDAPDSPTAQTAWDWERLSTSSTTSSNSSGHNGYPWQMEYAENARQIKQQISTDSDPESGDDIEKNIASLINSGSYILHTNWDSESEDDVELNIASLMVTTNEPVDTEAPMETVATDSSEHEISSDEETESALKKTEDWTRRMKCRHERNSEVSQLQMQGFTPAAKKRAAKQPNRLKLSGQKLILTRGGPILPDEIDAAFIDSDNSQNSIDLGSESDEITETEPDQHSIHTFFKRQPVPLKQAFGAPAEPSNSTQICPSMKERQSQYFNYNSPTKPTGAQHIGP